MNFKNKILFFFLKNTSFILAYNPTFAISKEIPVIR